MAFQEKVLSIAATETLLFECPATLAGSIHGLVFSNVTNAAQELTLKHYTKATGLSVTISQDRTLAANSEFTWPKPINVAAGDRILASTPNANAVVALTAVYLAPTTVITKGFTARGVYSDTEIYEINDLVSELGTSYVAIAPSTGNRPPSAAWMVLAAKGAAGAAVSVLQDSDLRTANLTSLNFTGAATVSGTGGAQTINVPVVDLTSLGLTNVDNTADLDKPVSTATQTALDLKAPLVGGVVPSQYLPSFVDDVLEFPDFASFPVTGETGKIYLDLGTANTPQYRWSGSAYVLITSSPGSTDAVPEGATNKYFTESKVLSTILTGLSLASSAAVEAADNFLAAMGKLQKQITNLASSKVDNFTSQTKKTFFSAPNAVDGVPSFREIVPSDVPTLNQNTTGTAANVTDIVAGANGGTGVDNSGKTLTLGGNHVNSGAFASTFTFTGTTNVTFPTSGRLATLEGLETLSYKTFVDPVLGTPASGNLSNCTRDGVRPLGFINIPVVPASANYTITKAHAGKSIRHPGADTAARIFTIDSNANQSWDDGTTISVFNKHGAGVITIRVTTDVMRKAGDGTTGDRTLAANGMATFVWDAVALDWQISGVGLT